MFSMFNVGTTVHGLDTQFMTELNVGDAIIISELLNLSVRLAFTRFSCIDCSAPDNHGG